MAEAAVAGREPAPSARGLVSAIAWRNLWRNRRRTWLSAGAVAFAVGLTGFGMAMQAGVYGAQIESATAFFAGHVQLQRQDYIDRSRFEHAIDGVTPLLRDLESRPGVVSAAARVEAFALASVGDRSFGAQVLGVDLERERRTVRFLDRVAEGRMIQRFGEVAIGSALARNLGVGVGGEVVVLGAGREGGVAALAGVVTGIFNTGMADFDRSLMVAPIAAVQEAFGLGDEAHALVVRIADVEDAQEIAAALNADLPPGVVARSWQAALPEVSQAIEVDALGGVLVYAIIMLVVAFSVVNAFIMTVFERTREFGMLRAIGMRPGAIMGMLQIEAFLIWLLGVGLAFAVASPAIYWLSAHGFHLGEAMSEFADGTLFLPDRLRAKVDAKVLLTSPLIMLAGVQIAALIPSLRIRRLRAILALRAE
ncbi:MAG: FtsX-like permease family protein [Gammaproteobacteria bacterium]|nr:FtsX-like permease family protein [Gammaproteobacteria bacterium]